MADKNEKHTIQYVKKHYKLPETYKNEQKASNKTPLPYETIDYSIYREAANCVVFLTSVSRMHFWILAFVQGLVKIKQGSQDHQVKWTDFPLGDEKPEKTEFQVYVKDDEYEEEFVLWYKVIVYITVGKVMVQGKGYRSWCEEEFPITLDIVNILVAEKDLSLNLVPPLNTFRTFEHAESVDETFVKSVVSPSDPDPDPDTEIVFNLCSKVRSSPVKKQSVGENNSELNKEPNLDKLHETSNVENPTSSCDDDLYDSRLKKNFTTGYQFLRMVSLKIQQVF